MSDIFNRRTLQYGGSFAADSATVNLTSGVPNLSFAAGLVTQSIQVSYTQPITRLYEVGTNYIYYIAGRPQGQASMSRVLGPGALTAAFYQTYGDVCLANTNHMTIDISAGCSSSPQIVADGFSTIYFLLNNVLIQSLGMSVGAQDMVINESLSMMFTSLEAFDDDDSLNNECINTYGDDCTAAGAAAAGAAGAANNVTNATAAAAAAVAAAVAAAGGAGVGGAGAAAGAGAGAGAVVATLLAAPQAPIAP